MAALEVDFDQQFLDARKVIFQDAASADRETMLFLCGDGKAQNLMANCKNCKAGAPQALEYWVCRRDRAHCIANFGLENTKHLSLVGKRAPDWRHK